VLFATFGKQDAVGVPSPVAGISFNSARHRFMQFAARFSMRLKSSILSDME